MQSVGNSLAYLSCKKGKLGLPPQTRTQRTFREKSFGISKAFALGAAVYNSVAFGIAPLYGIAMQGIEFEQGKNPVQSPQLVPPHPYGKVDVYNDFINNLKLIK